MGQHILAYRETEATRLIFKAVLSEGDLLRNDIYQSKKTKNMFLKQQSPFVRSLPTESRAANTEKGRVWEGMRRNEHTGHTKQARPGMPASLP